MSDDKATLEKVLAGDCPAITCHARAGAPCKRSNGEPRQYPHGLRWLALHPGPLAKCPLGACRDCWWTGWVPVTPTLDDADRDRLSRLEDWLHERRLHPDFEYKTTSGQRKAWDDADTPPPGDDWQRNLHAGHKGEGWERFDYHEESYWMRPKTDAALR